MAKKKNNDGSVAFSVWIPFVIAGLIVLYLAFGNRKKIEIIQTTTAAAREKLKIGNGPMNTSGAIYTKTGSKAAETIGAEIKASLVDATSPAPHHNLNKYMRNPPSYTALPFVNIPKNQQMT